MKNTKVILITTAVVIGMIMAFASAAVAKGKPPTTTTSTTMASVAAPSCFERYHTFGATGWNLGSHEPGTDTYSATVPACIDITEPNHLGATQWKVSIEGEASRFKGLKLVFEQGVHGTVFAETVITPDDATVDQDTGHLLLEGVKWIVTVEPTGEPVSFVAMPRNGDKWLTDTSVTLQAVETD